MKKIWKKQINGKISHIHGLQDDIVEMTLLHKAICIFGVILNSNSMAFFIEGGKKKRVLKFIWNQNRAQFTKEILRKKNKIGGNHTSRFQTILQNYSNQKSFNIYMSGTELRAQL